MVSVIIAAHNEEAVIGRCLEALAAQRTTEPLEIIVSANGCSDGTARVATEHGVRVIDREEPGKSAALNAAERVATSFPRVYLDADIVVSSDGLQHLLAALGSSTRVMAVAPRRRIDTTGRTWPVRGYFAINERLPVFRHGLFGRGMIALSAAGRARFEEFPELIADDLFVDSLFADTEKREAPGVEVVVEAPLRTKDLLARLVRVRRGNAQLRAAAAAGEISVEVRPADRWAWLRDVVVPHPHLVFAAVPYVVITLLAGRRARRAGDAGWGRDESTRARRPDAAGGAR